MPLYEYWCEKCENVFEALRPLRESGEASPCPKCGSDSERVLSTSFSAMSRRDGYAQRVPYHQRPIRNVETKKRSVVRLKGKPSEKSAKKGKGKRA